MSYWIYLILLTPALAQTAPPPDEHNYRAVPLPEVKRAPIRLEVKEFQAPPKVCSIPLVGVPLPPKGAVEPMPIARPYPSRTDPRFNVQLPAPPCDDGK